MEGSLPNTRRTIRTNGYVLQIDQLASNVPNDNEHNLLEKGSSGMAISLHGWHRDPYKAKTGRNWWATSKKTPTIHAPHTRYIETKWSIFQTWEMQVQEGRNRVLRSHSQTEHPPYGPKETQSCCGIANSKEPHEHSTVFRIHRILLILCPKLLQNCTTIIGPYEENNSMALRDEARKSIQKAKKTYVQKSGADTTWLWKEILSINWHIGIWRGHHTLTRGRKITIPYKASQTNTISHRLLLGHLHTSGKKLQHLRKGTASHDKITWTLEAILGMDKRTVHNPYRSRQPTILESPKEPQSINSTLACRSPGVQLWD